MTMLEPFLLTVGTETLDPETWPMWLKLMAGWGPLGAIAGLSITLQVRSEKAHHATRNKHEQTLQQLAKEHRNEITTLTERFVSMVEKQAEAQRKYAEAVKRKRGAPRDPDEGAGGDVG